MATTKYRKYHWIFSFPNPRTKTCFIKQQQSIQAPGIECQVPDLLKSLVKEYFDFFLFPVLVGNPWSSDKSLRYLSRFCLNIYALLIHLLKPNAQWHSSMVDLYEMTKSWKRSTTEDQFPHRAYTWMCAAVKTQSSKKSVSLVTKTTWTWSS